MHTPKSKWKPVRDYTKKVIVDSISAKVTIEVTFTTFLLTFSYIHNILELEQYKLHYVL